MPTERARRRAQRAKQEGKAPTTQAGEFVREEIHHIREGKHGARSPKQAIAIGLSKARQAGVKLPPPKKGTTSEKTRNSAERAYERGQRAQPRHARSPRRGRGAREALKKEGRQAGSRKALSQQSKSAAGRRRVSAGAAKARKPARTKAPSRRKATGKKAARSKAARRGA